MNPSHSHEQLLIDLFVARRDNLVSDARVRDILQKFPFNLASGQRLSVLLAQEGLSQEAAAQLDRKGSAYALALIELGFDSRTAVPSRSMPDELDTLMEASSVATPQSEDSRPDRSNLVAGTASPVEHRYQKVHAHAEGGLGKVWLASDLELNRKVALKEIQPFHADEPGCRARFLLEAEITGSLQHPGIVPVYGLGCYADGRPYYAMRFIEGQTLKDAIDALFHGVGQHPYRDGPWRVQFRRMLSRFLEVCNTIEYAHSRHVIHRDIKPSNIMLGAFGETLVVDWGLAKSLSSGESADQALATGLSGGSESELTMLGTAVGTPAYMSPEQAGAGREFPVGIQSDIYSLGASLFHILQGTPPTHDDSARIHAAKANGLKVLPQLGNRPDIPRPLASVCRKAMAENPSDRYASAQAFAADIENWLADQPVTAHVETWSEHAIRWIRLHPTVAVTSVVASVLLIGASVVGLSLRNQYQLDIIREQQIRSGLAESHRQQVATSVASAKASALVEIRNERFAVAIELLDSAVQQMAGEPTQVGEREEIEAILQRTHRLLDFYRYLEQAEELTFQDSSRRSSTLLQRALHAVGAFHQREWWNALPSQDLDPYQVHRLRSDTYRAMFLLTSLRLKQTIPADLNIVEMLKLVSAESNVSNQASILLCDQLDAYRLSQGAQLGRDFAQNRIQTFNQVIRGMTFGQKTIEWEAKNVSDLYIMGTALAYLASNTTPEERKRFEAAFGFKNSQEASKDMLVLASDLQRDHYWTQLVRAFFESIRGEHQAAARSYSHAIALNPEHWVGYAWLGRDMLDLAVSLAADSPEKKTSHQSAIRNLERAIDLKPDSRNSHYLLGNARSWVMVDPNEAILSFLQALHFQEPLETIHDQVIEEVDRRDLEMTLQWCQTVIVNYPDYSDVHSCIAWAEFLRGNYTQAQTAADRTLELDATNRIARLVTSLVDSHQGSYTKSETELSRLCVEHEGWFHAHIARAQNAERNQQLAQARRSFQQALTCSETNWHSLLAQKGVARISLAIDTESQSLDAVAQAIQLSMTEPLTDLLELASARNLDQAKILLDAYHHEMEPITELESTQPILAAPLLNGDFEMGLTYCWGDTLDKVDLPVWQRFNGSRAIANVRLGAPHLGEKSLYIENSDEPREGRYAELSQQLPVQIGTRYAISLWVRSNQCSESAVELLADDLVVISVPAGEYAWREIRGEFESKRSEVEIRIRCQGVADIQLDSLRLNRL